MKRLPLCLLATLLIAAAVFIWIQHQAQEKLRAEINSLTDENNQLKASTENLSNLLAQANSSQGASKEQLSELLKLRGEVSMLRGQSGQLAKLRTENQQLLNRPAPSTSTALLSAEDQFVLQKTHTVNALKQIGLAMIIRAGDNNNQYPTNFDQIKNELSGATNFYGDVNLSAFELASPGIVSPSMPNLIMTREITPRQTPWGSLERAYGMADGSVQEVSGGSDGGTSGFDKFEAEHSPQPQNP